MLVTVTAVSQRMVQVFDHEATMRLMAGANPTRSIQRRNGSTLRHRRGRQLSAATDRLHKSLDDCISVTNHLNNVNGAAY